MHLSFYESDLPKSYDPQVRELFGIISDPVPAFNDRFYGLIANWKSAKTNEKKITVRPLSRNTFRGQIIDLVEDRKESARKRASRCPRKFER